MKKQLLLCLMLLPFVALSQHARTEINEEHDESMSDPYLPNQFNNQKVSSAYRYSNHDAAKLLTGTSIVTYQVNVNASGQNIQADAANEPNIAVNPLNHNEMAIGWRQFDNISSNFRQAGWAYTTDGGQTWTFPGVIEPGIFRSDPVLDYDANGGFYYNSLSVTGTNSFFCDVFKSGNAGATWNPGVPAAGGDKQWMAIDRTTGPGAGNIYAFWSYYASSCASLDFTRSTDSATSFEPCTYIDGGPHFGGIAVGPDGDIYTAGRNVDNDSVVFVKSSNAQMPGSTVVWDTPVYVSLDGTIGGTGTVNVDGLNGQVNIDIDRSGGPSNGNIYILAAVQRISVLDLGDIMFVKSTDGGLTWTNPVKINDDSSTINTQWFGTMSVAPNGRIDVVWLDTRNGSADDSSALYYSYSTDAGNTWSPNEMLSTLFNPHVGYPSQNKMGDYYDMISDNAGADLAWAATFNGEQDVYYSRITPSILAGINENSLHALTVYPNPANGVVHVTCDVNFRYELYNVLGTLIDADADFNSKKEFDLSLQSPGIYLLKVTDENGNSSLRKIVRN